MASQAKISGSIWVNTLSINKKPEEKEKYLYCGLWDICAPSLRDLNRLTKLLKNNEIFYFYNTGRYAGKEPKLNLEFTFDDGTPSINWLRRLIRFVTELNKQDCDIKIKVNKALLTENKVENFAATNARFEQLSSNKSEIVADIYIYWLRKIMKEEHGLEYLSTQAKGKLNEKIPSQLIGDRLYIKI